MGRIAKALKKAQQERAEKLRIGTREDGPARNRSIGSYAGTCSAVADVATEEPLVDLSSRMTLSPRQTSMTDSAEAPVCTEPVEDASDSVEAETVSQVAQKTHNRLRGLRVLIPSLKSGPLRRDAGPLGPMPPWDVHPALVTIRERDSGITEQYRAVRTWLLRRVPTNGHSCLTVTSSIPREGKSVTVANLAAVMAEVRHLRVLAVDADFRQGRLAQLFKISNGPGLADVVAGRAKLDEALRQTPLDNLTLMPAGIYQGLNPAELINSITVARVFEEIRDRYHFILVDTPPVQKLSDTGVIGALCTGVLMVVRMNKAPVYLVKRSLHWLQSNNLNVIGCVASCCDSSGGSTVYRGSELEV